MWLAADVENLASSICPPRSPAGASHGSNTTQTTLCFMIASRDAPHSGRRPGMRASTGGANSSACQAERELSAATGC